MQPKEKQRLLSFQEALATALASIGAATANDPEIGPVIEALHAMKRRVDRAVTELEAGKNHMATMPNNRRNSLLAQLINVFKAVPESQLSDLQDALDFNAQPGADVFNSGLRHDNPDERQNPTGSPEAASGGGAVRMVGAYSDATRQSALVEQYAEMARELETMRTRMADVEKALSATATAFAAMLGMSKNATIGKASDDDAPGPVERTSDDKEDDDDVEKGRIRTISIADMMQQIAGKARETTVRPPDFSMMKAKVKDADALLNSGDLSVEAMNDVMVLKSRMRAFQAGHITARQVYAGLDWLPDELKVAL